MQNLISVTQAESIIREHLDRAPVEFVHLDDAHGRYLREDILADRPLPPFDRVMMDGIAIAIASFTSGITSFPIAGTQAAGSALLSLENSSTCIEVMTGCVLPHGCDCVIPIELIDLSENTATLNGEVIPKQGQHIHPMGNDTEKGAALLQSSIRLGAAELAIAASVGATKLRVSSLPTILIITTGDELVAPETEPLPHQIRRSHATALEALITSMNLGVVKSTHLKDDPSALKEAITDALPSYDILILTGGVSRGKYDYVAPVLTELLGTPHFHGIAQRPGKPMAFWSHTPDNVSTAGADDGSAAGGEECKRARADDGSAAGGEECKRLIFALPGNPVSVMACSTRYLIPSLKEILSTRPTTKNTLSTSGSFHCPPHFTGLVPCKIKNGRIQLTPPSNSGNFLALANSDGIAELPGELTGKELLNEAANFYPWS